MTYPQTSVAPDLVPPERHPPATRGEVVVWGLLGSCPFGGMTWQVLHHLVGLRRLGFDVWYVEDSDDPVYDVTSYWQTYEVPEHNLTFVADAMKAVGLEDRWVFRHPQVERTSGTLDAHGLQDLYRRSRAVFNVCGANALRPHHDDIPFLVYLETDPVWSQVSLARGDAELTAIVDRHDILFTYGANIGRPDCPIPDAGRVWHPTRPPVVVEWWAPRPGGVEIDALTTVANWHHSGKDVEWGGVTYQWRKDVAFTDYLDLPSRSPLPLELALGAIRGDERAALADRGWRVLPSLDVADPGAYRDYIAGSLGEFTVTKDQYVRTRSGWFSDRSVCYLAAGRPVVTQDTGAESWVRAGEGLLFFRTPEEALAAVADIASDPERHRRAALDIAREFFAAERVLGDVAATAGLLE
jgi:hypothetical protein